MRIGIDIDDTIINTTATIIECGLEYDRLYKEGRGLKNADAYYFTDIFYWDDADDEAFFDYYRKNKNRFSYTVQTYTASSHYRYF